MTPTPNSNNTSRRGHWINLRFKPSSSLARGPDRFTQPTSGLISISSSLPAMRLCICATPHWLNTFGTVIAAVAHSFGQHDREWIALYADGTSLDAAFLSIDPVATPTLQTMLDAFPYPNRAATRGARARRQDRRVNRITAAQDRHTAAARSSRVRGADQSDVARRDQDGQVHPSS